MSKHLKQPRIVPWKSDNEISLLANGLYSFDQKLRLESVEKIQMFHSRGGVPQAMEATASLVSSVLADEAFLSLFEASGFSNEYTDLRLSALCNTIHIRQSYSTALLRFVNGTLDVYQKSTHAIALYTLANYIGLPTDFVDIRHMCTHEELPSLELLRLMAQRALEWLRKSYWEPTLQALNSERSDNIQNSNKNNNDKTINTFRKEGETSIDDITETTRKAIKECLRTWRRIRRSGIKKKIKSGDTTEQGINTWNCINKIKEYAINNMDDLIYVLVYNNCLLPSSASLSDTDLNNYLDLSLKLFSPLFGALNDDISLNKFTDKLLIKLIDILNSLEWTENNCYISFTKTTKSILQISDKQSAQSNENSMDNQVLENALLHIINAIINESSLVFNEKDTENSIGSTISTKNFVAKTERAHKKARTLNEDTKNNGMRIHIHDLVRNLTYTPSSKHLSILNMILERLKLHSKEYIKNPFYTKTKEIYNKMEKVVKVDNSPLLNENAGEKSLDSLIGNNNIQDYKEMVKDSLDVLQQNKVKMKTLNLSTLGLESKTYLEETFLNNELRWKPRPLGVL